MRFSTVSLVAAFAATALASEAYTPPPSYGAPAAPPAAAPPAGPPSPPPAPPADSGYPSPSSEAPVESPYPTEAPSSPEDNEECPEEGSTMVSEGTTYVWTTVTTTVCETAEPTPTPATNETSPEQSYPAPPVAGPSSDNTTSPVAPEAISGASRLTLTTGALASVFIGVMYLL